ncbi:hypothetical protein GCM10023311_24640 [Flaviramulus aquimarinus]|uniref:DUF7467 domain-containing protein n=1 Tax=Flaviramulus aquimarinus TaxID=1170456 RepID=A0ABP9FL73_9FLAO
MKKIILSMLGICFLFLSCETEFVEPQEEEALLTASSSSDHKKKKKDEEAKYTECIVIDADRSPFGAQQQAANFWWSKTADGSDYFDRSTYFSSTDTNTLVFREYENGTANILGSTVYGTCVVTVDVWLKDKKTWDEWSALGGGHKKEGTAGDASNSEDMHFYIIDSAKSTVSASGGDCVQEGTFGLEQRPDPNDDSTPNFGAHIGIGGANYDSDLNAIGLSTWGWLTDRPTSSDNCNDCDGKITEMSVAYDGPAGATVVVTGDKGGSQTFNNVQPGDTLTATLGDVGNWWYWSVNGEDDASIHTSCSDDILGNVDAEKSDFGSLGNYPNPEQDKNNGTFLVVSHTDENNNICSNTPGERLWLIDFNFKIECPEVECQPCEGKVTELELEYNGDAPADIVVKTKGKGKDKEGAVVFEGTVMPGETFSFIGNDDKGTLGTEITIYANGSVDEKIHTSCSVPIGPGAIFGDYTVISGASREGGELCPEETPPGDDCSECEGKVTDLELQYDGGIIADIVVKTKGKGKDKEGAVVFEGTVMPGETFSFVGNDDKGTLGTEISIYVNGSLDQKIHTSCSVPIGPGAVFGDYTVISGASREGGELCDTDYSEEDEEQNDDCDCDGKLTELDLSYSGASALITVKTKGKGKKKKGEVLFEANVNNGGIIQLVGNDKKGTLGTEIKIYINGSEAVKIHTSCSDPNVVPGYKVGDFEVIRGASRNNGELCANDDGGGH